MSQIDQAFIKAYAGQSRSSHSPEPHFMSASRTTDSNHDTGNVPMHQLGSLQPGTLATAHSAAALDTLEPCQWVDRFELPETCQSLIELAGVQLKQLAAVVSAQAERGGKLVLVTGCARGEGRSSTLLCLAHLLARAERRVAVVDADFARAGLARHVGLTPDLGWLNVLDGSNSLAESLIAARADYMTLLPLSGPAPTTDLQSCLPRMRLSFALLRKHYDHVLIDAGPLDDAASLVDHAHVDAAILVHKAGPRADAEVKRAEELLAVHQIPLLGVAENFG